MSNNVMRSKKIICNVYRSKKKDGLYLYVPKASGLSTVPEALLSMFGSPELAFSLLLTPERKLAKEDIQKVFESLDKEGFYLQLPPVKQDDYMQEINRHNHKMADQ
ncbi:YcgL domain-containing protein [Marinagarivorans algicola]|uniref:YcgL domain-containing protein n=2 Tax=Marinagarivorans algicola TaxID=1513270 RepID=UPI0037356E30